MTLMNWGLRPVKTPDGKVYVREVYYTESGEVCDVEMQIKHDYHPDQKIVEQRLCKMYYNMAAMKLYNPTVLKYDPDSNLAEWYPDETLD